MSSRTRTARFALLIAALALHVLPLASCSRRDNRLHGLEFEKSLAVGDVAVREVHAAGDPTSFRFRARPGGLLYVFFGYANCPDVCPTTLADLRRALKMLGTDSARIDVAFVTVDPARDSAEVLVPFVNAFVTGAHALQPGSQEELAGAERAFGATSSIARRADGGVDVSHTGASYIVDANGRVLLEWDYGAKPADMAADLRVLLRLQQDRK
jgi:protein SCO1/2